MLELDTISYVVRCRRRKPGRFGTENPAGFQRWSPNGGVVLGRSLQKLKQKSNHSQQIAYQLLSKSLAIGALSFSQIDLGVISM